MNTKTCLPINKHGEYREAPFSLFSPTTANRRKCLKKSNSIRTAHEYVAKGANLFLSTASNRKRSGLIFFFVRLLRSTANCNKKSALFYFSPVRRIKKKDARKQKKRLRRKRRVQLFFSRALKIACCSARNRPDGGCCCAKRLLF